MKILLLESIIFGSLIPLLMGFSSQLKNIARPSLSISKSVKLASAAPFAGGFNLQFNINGTAISYDMHRPRYLPSPIIFYLPGLVREKNEAKSINLHTFCKRAEFTYVSADYFGVGRSKGRFEDASISRWTTDTIALIDHVLDQQTMKQAKQRVVLVGHGLGAWIAFLIAAKRPDIVKGIVGMSADPDFTEELLWKNLSEDIKDKIMQNGVYEINWGNEKYPITRSLIEDGRRNLLLAGGPGIL